MGNNRSVFTLNNQPQLLVRTGDQKGKGTDANVYVILYGRNKRKSKTIPLECSFRDNFERGQTDNFPVSLVAEDGKPLGRVQQIELWRDDTGLGSDWFCDLIILLDLGEGASIPFPVQRWIRPNYCYRIEAYDTSLPQDDPNPIQRKQELDYKRTVYRFSGKDPDLPGLMAECPSDEEYSDDYTVSLILTFRYKIEVNTFHLSIFTLHLSSRLGVPKPNHFTFSVFFCLKLIFGGWHLPRKL